MKPFAEAKRWLIHQADIERARVAIRNTVPESVQPLYEAAPELLEALDLALFALEGASNESEGRQRTMATIQAALRKARGQ